MITTFLLLTLESLLTSLGVLAVIFFIVAIEQGVVCVRFRRKPVEYPNQKNLPYEIAFSAYRRFLGYSFWCMFGAIVVRGAMSVFIG